MGVQQRPDAAALLHDNFATDPAASATTSEDSQYLYNSFPVGNLCEKERWKKFRVRDNLTEVEFTIDLGSARRPSVIAIIDTNNLEDVSESDTFPQGAASVYASNDATFSTFDDISYWKISPMRKEGFRIYVGPDEPMGVWYRHVEGEGHQGIGVLVCDDQRLLVVMDYSTNDILTAKLSYDGVIETSYGTDGFDEETITGNPTMEHSITTSTDKLLIAARTSGNISLIMLDQDGTVDTGFGTSGVANFNFNTETDNGRVVVEQSTGHFVVAGEAEFSNVHRPGLVRVDSSGAETDRVNFLLSGSTAGDDDNVFGITVDSSNNVYVVGRTEISGKNQSFIAKTDDELNLDTGFNSTGILEFDFTSEGSQFHSSAGRDVVVDSNGGIYVICFVQELDTDGKAWLGIAKFTSAGVLDTSFNGNGKKIYNDVDGLTYFTARKARLGDDGRITVFGDVRINGVPAVGMSKVSTNSNLDRSIGEDGIEYTSVGESPTTVFAEELDDGKWLLSGLTYSKNNDSYSTYVMRLLANGVVDTTFSPAEKNEGKRYWRITLDVNGSDAVDQWIGYLHIGDYLNIRPEPGAEVQIESTGNTFKAYNSDMTSDDMSVLRSFSFGTRDMSRSEVCALRDALEERGTHEPMVIDAFGRSGDREDQEYGLFYGYLEDRGAFDVTRRKPGTEDIKMKFKEAL